MILDFLDSNDMDPRKMTSGQSPTVFGNVFCTSFLKQMPSISIRIPCFQTDTAARNDGPADSTTTLFRVHPSVSAFAHALAYGSEVRLGKAVGPIGPDRVIDGVAYDRVVIATEARAVPKVAPSVLVNGATDLFNSIQYQPSSIVIHQVQPAAAASRRVGVPRADRNACVSFAHAASGADCHASRADAASGNCQDASLMPTRRSDWRLFNIQQDEGQVLLAFYARAICGARD